jgi:BirA family biotin operon repressor/biotin-[acetyl-CoA-carboxylase] ligase
MCLLTAWPWVNVVPVTDDSARRPPLDKARLSGSGEGLPPELTVEVVDEAASTNRLVAERARAGAEEGLVVVAEHQTAGRGRLDRTWETPARSSLTFSVLLRPEVVPAHWPWLPLLTGYAVAKALRAAGFAADVKWPNDVLVRGRKVAGILVERVDSPTGAAAVVGIGLNVDQDDAELPVETATSLALEAGSHPVPDRTDLLLTLLSTLHEAYAAWVAGGEDGTARLRASYAAACATVGEDVRVDLPSGEVLTGRATGVDADGRLEVQGPDGTVQVGAGDVVHVRALDR